MKRFFTVLAFALLAMQLPAQPVFRRMENGQSTGASNTNSYFNNNAWQFDINYGAPTDDKYWVRRLGGTDMSFWLMSDDLTSSNLVWNIRRNGTVPTFTMVNPQTVSNNISVWHNGTNTSYPTIHSAVAAAVAKDWVMVYGTQPITTNNWVKNGVNYAIYPDCVYVEQSTSSPGYGTLDDRATGATTNKFLFFGNLWYSAGTNGNINFSLYQGNDNCQGAVVSTNANTEWHFYLVGNCYGSAYDSSSGNTTAFFNLLSISTNSTFELHGSILPFAASFQNTNQLAQTKTILDQMNAIGVTSNGVHFTGHGGDIMPSGNYAIVSVADDPNINTHLFVKGFDRITKKIYNAWTSPNYRAWYEFTELNSKGQGIAGPLSFYGSGVVYVRCQAVKADSSILLDTLPELGASNIEVHVRCDKFEGSVAATSYVDHGAGFLDLQVNTYTNIDTSITNGIIVRAGRAVIHDGTLWTAGTASKGLRMVGGSAEIRNATIDTSAVNNAGNNPVIVQGGTLSLKSTTLIGPALADSITAGSAHNVGVYSVYATTMKNANITFAPNAGFTVDSTVK